jgi:MFS family permease
VANTSDIVSREPEQRPGLLFRNRDYTVLWIGETVSDFGTALSFVAYPLLVLTVTGSAAGAGVVEAATGIGGLITILFGGALADRFSRRIILITGAIVQMAAVSTVVAVVVTGHVSIIYIGLVGLVQGLAYGMIVGGQVAVLRRVVPADQLPAAFGQYEARSMTVRLVGRSLGGFLFGIARWIPFLCDALSFLASAFGVWLIRLPLGPDPDEREPQVSIFATIGTGLRFIRGNAYLRFLIVWLAFANACGTGLLLLVIVLVHSRHGSAALVGAVSSVGAAGGLAGAFCSSWIVKHVRGRLLVIVVSWITAAVAVGMGVVPGTWTVGVLMALMMFLNSPLNVVFSAYEAQVVPDALMSRVASAMSFAATSIRWLGPISAGFLASAFGPMTATLAFAVVMAAIAVSTHFASGLHVLDRPITEAANG